MKYVMGEQLRITRDRGKWIERKGYYGNLSSSSYPAALLRDESNKNTFCQDLKSIREQYKPKEDRNGYYTIIKRICKIYDYYEKVQKITTKFKF